MLPIGSRRRRLLYQSTHSKVANSTASMLRHGPRRRITSVLNKPLLLDAVRPTGQRIVIAITNAADRGFDASLKEALCVPNRNVLLGFKWSSQHQLAPISVARQRPRQVFATQASCAAGC